MTERIKKPMLIAFSFIAAFLLHLVIAEPQIYEQFVQPAFVWIWEQLYIIGSCLIGGFLELSCWIPLGMIICCFVFSILITFLFCASHPPYYWICPIICSLLGWMLSKDSSEFILFSVISYYMMPSILGIVVGLIQDPQRREKII